MDETEFSKEEAKCQKCFLSAEMKPSMPREGVSDDDWKIVWS